MLSQNACFALAQRIRELAAQEIMPRFNAVDYSSKADGSVVSQADTAMQQALFAYLAQHWPDVALLGEEMAPAAQQALLTQSEQALWCLDPLDGSSNFVAGLPFFSVSLALLERGQPRLGIVCDPVRDECFVAIAGQGIWLNGQPLQRLPAPGDLRQSMAVVDFKRLDDNLAARIAQSPPFRSQRNFGSCALEWAWLAAGRYQLYLHGGMKLWDYAAGVLLLQEAGGAAVTLQGEAVVAATAPTRSVVAGQNPALLAQWQQWLCSC